MIKLLQQWVTALAERRPEDPALVMGQESVTYEALESRSNQLAHALKEGGCRRGDRVCFLVPKSPDAIVTMLGILKADCIYVPLDPASPAPRAARIVDSCQPRWILASGSAAGLLCSTLRERQSRTSVAIGWMGSDGTGEEELAVSLRASDLHGLPGTAPDYYNCSNDAAYILFTSGSTGMPKGVVITHSNVAHFVSWANRYFGVKPGDRVSGHSPLHFDLSVYDVFGALAAGAQLHLAPPELNLLPNKLADFIRDSELTQWFSVPSALTYMARFDVVRYNDFPALERLLWCGEVFPTPALKYWMERLPGVTFTNLFGPTETTIASSYYTVAQVPVDETAEIPIGVGCEGEELLVLDGRMRPASPGQVGDLYIRGVGLSPGYWQDPEKTAESFLPNPFSDDPADRIYKTGDLAKIDAGGRVYFLGRAGSQIKSRGYRIELGEIETAVNALQLLAEGAVVAVDLGGFEGAAICCGYTPQHDGSVTPAQLRQELFQVLPRYMLPTRWLAFDRLPRNSNGKIDRPKLREAFRQHDAQTH